MLFGMLNNAAQSSVRGMKLRNRCTQGKSQQYYFFISYEAGWRFVDDAGHLDRRV